MKSTYELCHVCLSVCIYQCNPTGQISVKLSIGCFIKICLETPTVVKMGQEYWAQCNHTEYALLCFIGDTFNACYIVRSNTYISNTERMHCCISMAAVVMRTRHCYITWLLPTLFMLTEDDCVYIYVYIYIFFLKCWGLYIVFQDIIKGWLVWQKAVCVCGCLCASMHTHACACVVRVEFCC